MAAASIASTGIVLEALRKDNYENWSTLVKNYLVGEGLWHGIVESDPNKPDYGEKDNDSKNEWRWKNAKALHAIQLACGSENLSNIRKFEKAREAWNHLKISFSEDVRAFPDIEQGSEDDRYIYKLHSDVKRGNWDDAKSRLSSYPDSIFSTTPSAGRTVLHVAVASGQARIVKELVKMGNRRLLRMQDKQGYTVLALAAKLTDNINMAERIIKKGGNEMLTIKTKGGDDCGDYNGDAKKNEDDKAKKNTDGEEEEEEEDSKGEIPVLLASANCHKEMTRYLFSQTPIDILFDNGGYYGLLLLRRCISAEIFDVAVILLQHRLNKKTSLTHKASGLRSIVHALAHMPYAFRSGAQLQWWQQLIYNALRLRTRIDLYGRSIEIVLHIEADEEPADTNTLADLLATHPLGRIFRTISALLLVKHLGRLLGRFKHVVQNSIIRNLPGSDQIYEMKMNHYLVLEILKCLSRRISVLEESELHECLAYDTMLVAAKNGTIEFINSMRNANLDLLWAMDKNKRGIFSHAILNRQEKVFELIHEIEGRTEMIASRVDVFKNNMLHLAAELGPSSDLDTRSNAALQMQRELHWYMAVEKIVPPKCKDLKNADGKKARELFSRNHESLVKGGEKWARDTASSFTLVGTLIITIMFAAAFTVPGGNDQYTGIPIFLKKHAFTVFILADAVSLITSSSSVLIFIGILTSRYAEKDFLRSLPLKLLFGLITLFFSVASMMIAFVSTLSMMLKGYRGVVIAAMSLAIIPVLVLIPTLLSLSLEILKSTLRPNLLTAKKKRSEA
ncbi:hypothetical protein HN51_005663 [Arachis hypogaea]|uniref:PGG domain-containing protein n=1 Tax=Arachis hypogaea TaxID=3818 RepID=A0A445DDQ5_ARAHY|nr:uncharacterized protein LOC112797352 [Arachis hypogaea]RYR61308.1 hypothetical protein Ahy_A04g018464 isoform A [Arachis hypogaea]